MQKRKQNFKKVLSKTLLTFGVVATLLIGSGFFIAPAEVDAATCDPTFYVKPSQAQAGSSEIIIKSTDVKKVYLDVKFGAAGQSNCTGKAYVVSLWNNAKIEITNNVDKTFNFGTVPAKEGAYNIQLQVEPGSIRKNVTVKVAKDTLNPPANVSVNIQPTDKPTNGDKGGFVPCGNTADNPCQIGHLFSAFIVIINYLIAMAGFLAVLAIVYAGFMMIYSQGQEKLKEAKGRFSGAIIGLVLVAAAFILINSLFSGSLSIGLKDGASILTDPVEYINK